MEKIEIKDFLGIKDITIEVKQINILIGPQASGKRCDYLVVLSDNQEIYIELKGSKVAYAVEQIIATIPQLTADTSKPKLDFICSTRCPMTSPEIQKLKKITKKKHNLKLTIKNGEIVYKI